MLFWLSILLSAVAFLACDNTTSTHSDNNNVGDSGNSNEGGTSGNPGILGTWSSPIKISNQPEFSPAYRPRLAMNDNDETVVVWQDMADVWAVTHNRTSGCSTPYNFENDKLGISNDHPQVAINASGKAIAVWDGIYVSFFAPDTRRKGGSVIKLSP